MMFGALPAAAASIPQFPQQDQPQAVLSTASLMPQSQPPAPHPSFFGQGGIGRGIAGTIGDYLLQANHMAPVYAPAVQQQHAEQYQQQQLAAQKDAAWKQWVAQQQYKAANPDPVEPTAIQKNYDWLKANHPEVADQYLQSQTTAPPIVQRNPDGTTTVYPSGMIPRGGSGIPTAPVGKLTPIQGGAGPSQAPQGFPLYPAR